MNCEFPFKSHKPTILFSFEINFMGTQNSFGFVNSNRSTFYFELCDMRMRYNGYIVKT